MFEVTEPNRSVCPTRIPVKYRFRVCCVNWITRAPFCVGKPAIWNPASFLPSTP